MCDTPRVGCACTGVKTATSPRALSPKLDSAALFSSTYVCQEVGYVARGGEEIEWTIYLFFGSIFSCSRRPVSLVTSEVISSDPWHPQRPLPSGGVARHVCVCRRE